MKPGKWGAFSKPFFAGICRNDPDVFPKSQTFKKSCSSHSENAHIKVNLNETASNHDLAAEAMGHFLCGLDVEIWPKSGVPHQPPELLIHLDGVLVF